MITAERISGTLEAGQFKFTGLSGDTKPTEKWGDTKILNASTFFEMDTFKPFFYDEATDDWVTKEV